MSNLQKGIRFERAVRTMLRERGCSVFRQAASQFPDLIVLKHGGVWLIECKMRKYLSRAERKLLLSLASMSGAIPMVAFQSKRTKKIVIELVKGWSAQGPTSQKKDKEPKLPIS